MVLTNILASLKLSTRLLKTTSKSILPLSHQVQANTITDDPSILATPQLPSLRTAVDSALADLSLATSLTAKYQAVLRGIPLDHDSSIIDRFTTSIDHSDSEGSEHEAREAREAVVSDFIDNIAGGTGLEYYLCGQDSSSGENVDEWATEEEVFATYRAIGGMGFTEFELGVHRAVCRAEEMAVAVAGMVEEMRDLEGGGGETVTLKGKEKEKKSAKKKVVKQAKKKVVKKAKAKNAKKAKKC